MAYFDWDIGPNSRRWERTGNGDIVVSKNEPTYWLHQFEVICTRRGITTEECQILWEAMAHVCSQQLQEQRGAFYDAMHPLCEGKGAKTQTDPSVSE